MVLGKVPSPVTEAITDAHLAAIARLQRIVETSNSAIDFEMLGVCHQLIEDTETAAKMFSKALEIERANNPQSEMLGRLMKRASSV
jgi:predicted negative regulator of RcsB-dependent stress response